MRQIDPELQARLDGGATNLCRCWLVTRRDGLKLGFTDHDRDLLSGGEVFRAGTGLDAGAIQTSTGLSVDNAAARGALSADGLRSEDLTAGLFDNAGVQQWLVDWTQPELRVALFRGFLGEIRRGATAFEAELRGLGEALNKPKGRVYLRSCDAVLGDRRCGVDLDAAAYSVEATVLGCDAGNVRLAAPGAFADGWFARGSIEWLSGANAGLGGVIKTDRQGASGRMLALWQEPPFPVVAGDLAKLAAGCDKAAATCKAKFGNFMNFRGFPDMPGDDWVVSYPGRGERLDGGSLHNDQ